MLEISERCLSGGGAVQRGGYGVLVSEGMLGSGQSAWAVTVSAGAGGEQEYLRRGTFWMAEKAGTSE